MAPSVKIAPSLLSGDFSKLGEEANRMLDYGADWLHMDVMDGHFVPNLTIGAPVIQCVRSAIPENVYLDCHLMVSNPEKWIEAFKKAGASGYTFHIETIEQGDEERLITEIRDAGMKAGLAVKPNTDLERVKHLAEAGLVDMVLIMTVEPGFGGQSFMEDMMPKVKELRSHFPDLEIQVDGGIDKDTIAVAAEAGANIFVSGSTIFKADDPKEMISSLRSVAEAKRS